MNLVHRDKRFNYIYKTTNLLNGKIYVGQRRSNTDPTKDKYLGSGKILKRSIEKNGGENFIREILEIGDPDNLNEREIYWIDFYQSRDHSIGYNIGGGGDGGYISEEVYKQTSLKMKGKPHSKEHHIKVINSKRENGTLAKTEESKQKTSASLKRAYENGTKKKTVGRKGEDNHFFGKHHSPETIAILREQKLGKKIPEEAMEKRRLKLASHPEVECTFCHLKGKSTSFIRNHFENCKQNPDRIITLCKCIHCGLETENKTNIVRWHNDNCKHKLIN